MKNVNHGGPEYTGWLLEVAVASTPIPGSSGKKSEICATRVIIATRANKILIGSESSRYLKVIKFTYFKRDPLFISLF